MEGSDGKVFGVLFAGDEGRLVLVGKRFGDLLLLEVGDEFGPAVWVFGRGGWMAGRLVGGLVDEGFVFVILVFD